MGIEGGPKIENREEVNKKIIEDEGTAYFNEMLGHLEEPGAEFVGGPENFKNKMEAYKKAILEGNYFNEIAFESGDGDNVIEEKDKSPHDFLQGARDKYRMFQKEFSEKEPELSEDYKRRAEQIEKILDAMIAP